MKLAEGISVFCDITRSLAAQTVILGHAMSFFGVLNFLHYPHVPWMQNIAVIVFFILSGFIISTTLANKMLNENYGFYEYFTDRFSRIFSVFFPSLIFVLCLDSMSIFFNSEKYTHYNAFNLHTFFANIFMLQDFPHISFLNCLSSTSFGSARPFWTLAIEWWIYIFFGFTLLIFNKKPSLTNCIFLIFLSIVPFFNAFSGRGNGLTIFWLYGVISYFLMSQKLLLKIPTKLISLYIILVFFACICRSKIVHMDAYDPIFALFIATLFLFFLEISSRIKFPLLIKKCVRLTSGYSFTLYLIHYSILEFIYNLYSTSFNRYVLFIFSILLSNILAYTLGTFTEIKLKEKIRYTLLRYKIKTTLSMKNGLHR